MIKAIDRFQELETGIRALVRAADIYALHVMSKIRSQAVNLKEIEAILTDNKMSYLNLVGNVYTKKELKLIESEGHFKEIGQQIIVATHTALESYLNLKFKEYYQFIMSGSDKEILEKTINEFRFSRISDYTKKYNEYFSIYLPAFEIDFHSSKGCNFSPKDCWTAINLIDQSRHDIVHKGFLVNYKITSLMDSWYPFEFVQRWVYSFDITFDKYIYENKRSSLYLDYRERYKSMKKQFNNKL